MNGSRQARRVTMRDVASAAGVHQSTVSLVLAHDPRVSDSTRAKVEQVVRELGYVPSRAARALRRGRERVIAIVLWNGVRIDAFHHHHLEGIVRAAFKDRYQVLLLCADDALLADHDLVDYVVGSGAEGAICIGIAPDRAQLAALCGSGFPVVHVGERRLPHQSLVFASGDYVHGGRLASEHLLSLGHRRIACVVLGAGTERGDLRRAGYEQAMQGVGARSQVYEFPSDPGWGPEVWDEAFCFFQTAHITGVFLTEAPVACRLLAECRLRGVKVPGELSVIGFDDIDEAANTIPRLSVVRQPVHEIGGRAYSLLSGWIADSKPPEGGLRLPMELVLRESTARPPN